MFRTCASARPTNTVLLEPIQKYSLLEGGGGTCSCLGTISIKHAQNACINDVVIVATCMLFYSDKYQCTWYLKFTIFFPV